MGYRDFLVECSIAMRLFSCILWTFHEEGSAHGTYFSFMDYGSLFTGYGAFLVEYNIATHCHIFYHKSPVSCEKRPILYVDIVLVIL